MKCPYCDKEMIAGRIYEDRYALKWVAEENNRGLLNVLPFVEGIKLTLNDISVKVHYCPDCRKFIIDQDEIE